MLWMSIDAVVDEEIAAMLWKKAEVSFSSCYFASKDPRTRQRYSFATIVAPLNRKPSFPLFDC